MNRKEIKLELNGNDYVLPFGLGFLGECLENLGLNVQQIGQKLDDNPFKWIPTLMYESHKYKCLLDDEEVQFTYRELVNFLDDEEGKVKMNKYLIAFVDSLRKDVPKENSKGVKKKKPQSI